MAKRLTVLLFVLALVAAACGDDDSGGDTTTTTAAAGETTTTAEGATTTAAPATTEAADTARRIADAIRLTMGGADVAVFKDAGRRYDVRVQVHPEYRDDFRCQQSLQLVGFWYGPARSSGPLRSWRYPG